ncbi:hypothetical protein CSUB01_00423 [Colletotrichum sublineola]|uniref:Uncharacterized protein n=1 Tax=Colletotrichum sublineola TaxID=1173701 RepID=A0A066XFC7_COLSU|nr:hypothetical protein CSUB01_00423 [Colletotrichum sublineola]
MNIATPKALTQQGMPPLAFKGDGNLEFVDSLRPELGQKAWNVFAPSKAAQGLESETQSRDRVGLRLESLDGVAQDTTRALLVGRQNPQQRTLFDTSTSFSTGDFKDCCISQFHGDDIDLHIEKFTQAEAMTKSSISGPWRAIPDNLDPEGFVFEPIQALPTLEDLESSSQQQTLGYSDADFKQIYSPVAAEAPGDMLADGMPTSFFDEAFWTHQGACPYDTVDESEDRE